MLEIEDLHVSYLRDGVPTPAVRGASLSVPGGTSVALVGESGSGKSTIVLSVLRLLRPPIGRIDSGHITVAGEELVTVDENRMRQVLHEDIGYVPQDPSTALDPLFTVGRQINETLARSVPRRERRARIVDLLESLGVPDAASRLGSYPHEFSGGMQQRVAIAIALAREPKLLVADEPTTALDVTTQLAILRLLDRLRRERDLSLLFVTHDLSVAEFVCQEVVVLYAGCVMERGPTRQVIAAPRHPYTKALVGAIPQLSSPRRRLQAIAGQPPSANDLVAGCPFAPRCPLADARCHAESPPVIEHDGVEAACWYSEEVAVS